MELTIFDTDFNAIDTLDTFESLILKERYNKYGDFEIYMRINSKALKMLAIDNYLYLKEADTYMIIEDIQIKTDPEEGNKLIITGRSLESILDRRIVWAQTILTGNLQEGVRTLLLENIISSTDTSRNIPNFIFEYSVDPNVTSLVLDAQFTGDSLYDAVEAICTAYNLGFKIRLNDSNQFVFSLYLGANKSYSQLANPYVIFSPDFNNLANSSYLYSKKSLKTTTLVAGEGEGADRITLEVISDDTATSLDRREVFTDARDVSSITSEGTLPLAEYEALLEQRGLQKLNEQTFIESFDGQIEDTSSVFSYRVDYSLGDIVQIENEYNMVTSVRVNEIIQSQSASGIRIYPTLGSI